MHDSKYGIHKFCLSIFSLFNLLKQVCIFPIFCIMIKIWKIYTMKQYSTIYLLRGYNFA